MSKGKFAVGTIFGAVVGLVAGVLTAPKSGKETRADLKSKAEELKVVATTKTEDLKSKAGDVVGDVVSTAEDYKKRAEGAIEGAKEGFKPKK